MPVPRLAPALFLSLFAIAAPAQDYPQRPVRMILPYGTGGNTDTVSRILAPGMSADLGQQVVIENRGGGAGIPGMLAVAKAAPDGYTALFAASNLASNPILFRKLPYDAEKDFAPVTLVAIVPTVLVVHPSLPVQSVKQLIALAKAQPGALNYGSVGNGSGNHLTTEVFSSATGIKVEHVPYKSAGASMTDLIAGRITFIFSTIPAAHAHLASKRVRAVAVSSARRVAALPDVPTVAESGVPGFDVNTWLGMLVPAGTPARNIDRLNAATLKALQQPKAREVLTAAGAEPVGSTPAELGAHLKMELARWKKLAETVSFTVAD
jgi:tripartite-type tricarboxylate transporter receptor subunit TctC